MQGWLRSRPGLSDGVLALTLAAILLPFSITVIRVDGPGSRWAAAMYCAVLAMHLAVAFRRRAPVAAFTVCAASELLLALSPDLHDQSTAATYPAVLVPSSAAYLVMAYSVSAAGSGRLPLLSLLVGVTGSLIVTGRAWASGSTTAVVAGGRGGQLILATLLLASVVATWALGRLRRMRTEQLAAVAERAEADRQRRQHEAVTAERARIARELHDVIAHSVTVMVRQAEGGRYVAATSPQAAEAALTAIADTGRDALTDIRTMLGVLDNDQAPEAALDPQPTVEDLPRLVERIRSSGQPIRLRVEGHPQPLDRAAHLAAYRLVQEALTNVVKHAGPQVEAEVRIMWSDRLLRLEVIDQGTRFGTHDRTASGGRGLAGMRERLQLVGGTLVAGPAESGGFGVVGEIPTAVARPVAEQP